MVTQAQVEGLVRSHAENDLERFKSITLQISADAERKSNFRFARDLKHLTEGTRVLQPLPMHSKDIISQVIPRHTLESVFLAAEMKADLAELVREWKGREKVRARGLDVRRHLIFTGPPGTGKTATAGAIAAALDLPFFVVRLERLIESFLGSTAKNLRAAFDAVRITPGVYLFDEFDALGTSRSGKERGHDIQEMKRATNSLLQFLDEDGLGMVIAATNLEPVLDNAVWRRFEGKFNFRMPSPEEVMSVIRQVLSLAGLTPVGGLDWEAVTSYASNLSHADVEEAARVTARRVILDDETLVSFEDLTTPLSKAKRVSYE